MTLKEKLKELGEYQLGIPLQNGSIRCLKDIFNLRKPNPSDEADFVNYNVRMLTNGIILGLLLPDISDKVYSDLSQTKFLLEGLSLLAAAEGLKYGYHRLFNYAGNKFGGIHLGDGKS